MKGACEVPGTFHTVLSYVDVDFARVPNLLTKFNPVHGTYLPNPPSIFADGDGDAADRGLLGATARFSMPVVDPMI